MKMNVETKIASWKNAVDGELERILSRQETLLFQAMRYSVLCGGKRFRPLLLVSAADAFGVTLRLALSFACAVELIHNYSLIHDDLPSMDNDDYRRGRPSCHKAFGEDIALLAGDGLLTLAFQVMAAAAVPKNRLPRKEQVIKEIAQLAGAEGMIGGQLLDITFSPDEAAKESLHELMLKKTGALIVAAVRAGAVLGGAPGPKLDAMTEYGKNIGLAFQVRDDIRDAAETAKKERSAKPNYASVFGQEKAGLLMKRSVRAALGALKEASIESAPLRRLARRLLEPQT
jgi:geranylgeranyl diphosphate synthase type II